MSSSDDLERAIAAAQEAVTQQGDVVRSLKANVKEGKAQKVQSRSCAHTKPCNCTANCAGTLLSAALCMLQSDVDAAIQKLQQLKLDLGDQQKVSVCSPPGLTALASCKQTASNSPATTM